MEPAGPATPSLSMTESAASAMRCESTARSMFFDLGLAVGVAQVPGQRLGEAHRPVIALEASDIALDVTGVRLRPVGAEEAVTPRSAAPGC